MKAIPAEERTRRSTGEPVHKFAPRFANYLGALTVCAFASSPIRMKPLSYGGIGLAGYGGRMIANACAANARLSRTRANVFILLFSFASFVPWKLPILPTRRS